MINNILLVGLGGGLGSIARYLCQRWTLRAFPHSFPLGTFAVNVAGCFLIGLFWGMTFRTFQSNENWKLKLPDKPTDPIELYDLAKDPAEATNLASAHPDITNRLTEQLRKFDRSIQRE